jgi:hypothetical protein
LGSNAQLKNPQKNHIQLEKQNHILTFALTGNMDMLGMAAQPTEQHLDMGA